MAALYTVRLGAMLSETPFPAAVAAAASSLSWDKTATASRHFPSLPSAFIAVMSSANRADSGGGGSGSGSGSGSDGPAEAGAEEEEDAAAATTAAAAAAAV